MRLKQNKVQFYVSDEVRKKLEKLAKESGLTMTAIVSKLIMDKKIKPLPTQELLQVFKELNKIGRNINQIVYRVNTQQQISAEEIHRIEDMLNNIWKCVKYL